MFIFTFLKKGVCATLVEPKNAEIFVEMDNWIKDLWATTNGTPTLSKPIPTWGGPTTWGQSRHPLRNNAIQKAKRRLSLMKKIFLKKKKILLTFTAHAIFPRLLVQLNTRSVWWTDFSSLARLCWTCGWLAHFHNIELARASFPINHHPTPKVITKNTHTRAASGRELALHVGFHKNHVMSDLHNNNAFYKYSAFLPVPTKNRLSSFK